MKVEVKNAQERERVRCQIERGAMYNTYLLYKVVSKGSPASSPYLEYRDSGTLVVCLDGSGLYEITNGQTHRLGEHFYEGKHELLVVGNVRLVVEFD